MEEKAKEIWHEQRMNGGNEKWKEREKVGESKETANEGRGEVEGEENIRCERGKLSKETTEEEI